MARYWLNCVEGMIQNPKFDGFMSFRIEVFDQHSDSPYQCYEGNVLAPEEIGRKIYDLLDGYETDLPVRINIDMADEKCFPDEFNQYYGNILVAGE